MRSVRVAYRRGGRGEVGVGEGEVADCNAIDEWALLCLRTAGLAYNQAKDNIIPTKYIYDINVPRAKAKQIKEKN